MDRRTALHSLAALGLAGCARTSARVDGPLELLIGGEPGTLDPRFVGDIYALRLSRLVHAPLVTPDPDTLAARPLLAESIELTESGAAVATLRNGACFHDGRRIRARDVLATLEALGSATLAAPGKRLVDTLQKVEAPDGLDGLTVRITPKSPRATLLADLDFAILPAELASRPRGSSFPGSGPYRVDHVDGSDVYLRTAASYAAWGPSPPHRDLVARAVRDEAARALRMLAGAADLAPNALSPALAQSLCERADGRHLRLVRRPGATTTFLCVQLMRKELADPIVRRALSQCIDRRALIEAKLGGAATIASGLLPPMLHVDAPPAIAFDPAAARQVLAPLGARGLRLSLVVSPDRLRLSIARAIAQMIGDAGVPVDLRVYELGTLLARLSAGEFDLATLVASEVGDAEVLRWYLHSGAMPPRGQNRGRFSDAEVDRLLDIGVSTLKPDARRAIYADLEARLAAQLPLIPLWHEDHTALVGARARGFRPSADGRWASVATL